MKKKLSPIPDYGDMMTKEEFLQAVNTGCFIDYDGDGNLATAEGMSEIRIFPSEADKIIKDNSWATHVVWFNK